MALQYLAADTDLDTFARLGMLLLLFEVGLELSVRELFAVGPSSLLVALVTMVIVATLMTPPMLKWSWRPSVGLARVGGREMEGQLWRITI